MLHILQECWKEGHAAEEAWEAGRPPELAQPPADYEVQRTQILGQLQQVCSRAEGACTPQFVVEQVSRFPREMAVGGLSFQVQLTPLDLLKAQSLKGRCSPRRFKRERLHYLQIRTCRPHTGYSIRGS